MALLMVMTSSSVIRLACVPRCGGQASSSRGRRNGDNGDLMVGDAGPDRDLRPTSWVVVGQPETANCRPRHLSGTGLPPGVSAMPGSAERDLLPERSAAGPSPQGGGITASADGGTARLALRPAHASRPDRPATREANDVVRNWMIWC